MEVFNLTENIFWSKLKINKSNREWIVFKLSFEVLLSQKGHMMGLEFKNSSKGSIRFFLKFTGTELIGFYFEITHVSLGKSDCSWLYVDLYF